MNKKLITSAISAVNMLGSLDNIYGSKHNGSKVPKNITKSKAKVRNKIAKQSKKKNRS